MARKDVSPEPVPEKALEIIDMLPKGGVGVETGTHNGRFTEALRVRTRAAHMTLVDPWAIDEIEVERPFAFSERKVRMDQFRDHIAGLYGGRADMTIRVGLSADILPEFAPVALDWAWLDGVKYYDELTADLETLIPRMKPGGMIAGGGYFWAKQLGRPVREAVRDMADRIEGAVLEQRGQFWCLRLPQTVVLGAKPDEPRFLVISTMKNEAPYILEWVAHHRAIGFTDFLVFTNDCEDTTDPILDRLEEMGRFKHEYNLVLKRGPHKSALKYAKNHALTAKADWIMICDVDEFLNIRVGDGTVTALLDHLGADTDIVPFPWKVFGHGGVIDFEDQPITRQFVQCEPNRDGRKMRDVKTMFRNHRKMYHFGLHRPRVADEWKDSLIWKSPSGEDISARMNKGQPWSMKWAGCKDVAYQHHYPVRCVESYILKKNRGRANHVNEDLGMEYWDKWNMSGANDRSLRRGHPGFQAQFDALMADKALRKLHKQGVQWHKDQFQTLIEDPRYRALYETLRTQSETEAAAKLAAAEEEVPQ
jgi:hypothetical protein